MRRPFFVEWPEDWPVLIAEIAEVAGSAYGDLYALTWPQIRLRWNAHAKLSARREARRAAEKPTR